MKKTLMVSAVAAMAFAAQADVSYQVEITKIDQGSSLLTGGWIPSDISLALSDNTKVVQLYTDHINFSAVLSSLTTDEKYFKSVGSGYLFNALNYYNDFSSARKFSTDQGETLTLASGIDGLTLTFYKENIGADKTVFPGCDTREEASAYADQHLRTLLSASVDGIQSKTYELPAALNVSGAMQVGTVARLSAVPEPTSGLLAFLGLAGLMLKRKRAA